MLFLFITYIVCSASPEPCINPDHQDELTRFQGMDSSMIPLQQCHTNHQALPTTTCPLTTTHLKASSYPTYIERCSCLQFVCAISADPKSLESHSPMASNTSNNSPVNLLSLGTFSRLFARTAFADTWDRWRWDSRGISAHHSWWNHEAHPGKEAIDRGTKTLWVLSSHRRFWYWMVSCLLWCRFHDWYWICSLNAIMLGRLKMSTEDALHNYKKLATAVFSPDNRKPFYKNEKFRASTLEAEIKEIVKNSCEGYTGDEHLLDPGTGKDTTGNMYVGFCYVSMLLCSSLYQICLC